MHDLTRRREWVASIQVRWERAARRARQSVSNRQHAPEAGGGDVVVWRVWSLVHCNLGPCVMIGDHLASGTDAPVVAHTHVTGWRCTVIYDAPVLLISNLRLKTTSTVHTYKAGRALLFLVHTLSHLRFGCTSAGHETTWPPQLIMRSIATARAWTARSMDEMSTRNLPTPLETSQTQMLV